MSILKNIFIKKFSERDIEFLNIGIQTGALKLYDIMPGWIIGSNYEAMKKNRGLLAMFLVSNRNKIRKLPGNYEELINVGGELGLVGMSDFLTEIISYAQYKKFKGSLPTAKQMEAYHKKLVKKKKKNVLDFINSKNNE